VVLTEKDLIPTKPIIKKPPSFNPLGAIVVGLTLGATHALLYASLWIKTINVAFSIFGFLLLPAVIIALYFQVSLTAKYSVFVLKIEENKTKSALITREILLAYIGFVPSYGFMIVYSVRGLKLETLLITMGAYVILFGLMLYINFEKLVKKKVSLGYLLQWKYYINKGVLVGTATGTVVILTLIFFVACLI